MLVQNSLHGSERNISEFKTTNSPPLSLIDVYRDTLENITVGKVSGAFCVQIIPNAHARWPWKTWLEIQISDS